MSASWTSLKLSITASPRGVVLGVGRPLTLCDCSAMLFSDSAGEIGDARMEGSGTGLILSKSGVRGSAIMSLIAVTTTDQSEWRNEDLG